MVSFMPELSATLGDISPPQPQSVQDAMDIIGAHSNQPPLKPLDQWSTDDWQQAARRAAIRNGIDPDVYDRQIRQESGYNPDVIFGRTASVAGAQGIAQFMPQTAAGLGIDPLNPLQALDAGAKYLKSQIDSFGGDVRKGLAAYNAGAGNVQNAIARGGNDWGSYLPGETQQYLSIITGNGQAPIGGGVGSFVGSRIASPATSVSAPTPDLSQAQIGGSNLGMPFSQPATDATATSSIGGPAPTQDFSQALPSIDSLPSWAQQDIAAGKTHAAPLGGLQPIADAYNAANVNVPLITPAIENYVKPAVQRGVDQAIFPGLNAAKSVLGIPGPTPGAIAASQVPSKSLDLALTAAPEVGKLRELIPGVRAGESALGAGLAGGGDLERQAAEQLARDRAAGVITGEFRVKPQEAEQAARGAASGANAAPSLSGDLAGAPAPEPQLHPKSPEAVAQVARDEAAAQGAREANVEVSKAEWTTPHEKAAVIIDALDKNLGGDADVTLYRGTNPSRNPLVTGTAPEEGPGKWWTTDKSVAENYAGPNGQVQKATVKAAELADPEAATPVGGPKSGEWTLSKDLQARLDAAPVNAVAGSPVPSAAGEPPAPDRSIVQQALQEARGGGNVPPGGPPSVPPGNAPLPAGGGGRSPAEIAAQKLVTQVKMSEQLPADAEAARSAVRSQRAAQAYAAGQGAGSPEDLARASRNAVFQTGEMPTAGWSPPQGNFTPEDKQQLFQMLNDAKGRIGSYRHGQAVDAVDKVLTGDYAHLTQGDMKLLTDIYGEDLGKAIVEKVQSAQGPQRLSDKLYNAARSGLRNLSDLISAPISTATFGHAPLFRQGIGTAVSHPLSAWLPALKDFYGVLRNPENLTAIRTGLDENPWILGKANPNTGYVESEMANRGIRAQDFTTFGDKPQPTAVRNVMAKLGITGNRSQQAAAQYLDSLRKLTYADEAQRLWESGERNPREFQAIWDTISHATGVGVKENPSFNPAFSFKALTGRIKSLADPIVQPGGLNPMGPGARAVAVKNLVGIAAFGSTVMALDQLTGGKANLDITAGGIKTKVGLTTIDPYAGMGPIIRMFANSEQAIQNAKNPEDAISKIGTQVYQFAHGQLSPGYEYIASLLTGKDWKNAATNPMQATKALLTGAIPIAAKSIYDGIKDNYEESGLKAGIIGGLRSAGSLGAMSESTTLPSRNDRLTQDAVPALKQAGVIPNNDTIKSYQDLGGGEANAAQRWLEQNMPNEAARFKSERQATNSPYQAAQDKADAVQQTYAPKYDALYKSLLNGDASPRDIKDKLDNYRHEIIGNQAQIYNDPAYQKAVQQLQPNDIRKQEDQYFKIAGDAQAAADKAGVKPDYDAIDQKQAAFLQGLPADQRDRLQKDLALRNSVVNAPPIIKLQREVDTASKGYYDILGAQTKAKDAGQVYTGQKPEEWLTANPQANIERWLFYGDQLHSVDAVNAALAKQASGPEGQAAFKQIGDRPVEFAGLGRAIDQSPQIEQLWKEQGQRIANYNDRTKLINTYGDREAASLYDGKKFAALTPNQQANVIGQIKSGLRDSSPSLEALLIYMGDNIRNNEVTVPQDADVVNALKALQARYGATPPKAGVRYVFAKN